MTKQKTVVQCDFDGTVTEEDVSFMILDAFATGDWRQLHHEFEAGKMSVGRFNTDAFAMVKADRENMLKVALNGVVIRPGFKDLADFCKKKGFRLVIVSNGLEFYIKEILNKIGLPDIEAHAAETVFHPDGLRVQYVGPNGTVLDNDFKVAYVDKFLGEGYKVVYIGNGASDLSPARKSHYTFATDVLWERCQITKMHCTQFMDFIKVIKTMESWH